MKSARRKHVPPLPILPNRNILHIDNGVVCWTNPAGMVFGSSLKEWLDAVPPYVSTYPLGNKRADEAAESAHSTAMSWWRAMASRGDTVPEPVLVDAHEERLRAIEEAASSLLMRMDDVAKRVETYAGTQAGRAASVEVAKAKLDVALWADELRLALAK